MAKPAEVPVKLEANYYIWDKHGPRRMLSEHFSVLEFTCHCNYPDCKEQRISKDLIDKLELIRVEVKQPLVVTSAFRCKKYQAFLRANGTNTVVAKLSQHELGNAVDVVPKDGLNVRTGFLTICEKQFQAIGLSNKFLHLDLRPQHIRWEY